MKLSRFALLSRAALGQRAKRAWGLLFALPALVIGPALLAQAAVESAPRVVAIGGALTEIVYRLGAQKVLVATDTTSTYPAAAQALPKVGYQRSLSAEGVLALQPTIMLAAPEAGPPAVLAQLQSAGVQLARTSSDHTFDAVVKNVEQIANVLGLPAQGATLAQSLRTEWAATRAAIQPAGKPPRVLFILSHAANNVQVAGTATAADAMIRLAGGVNAISGFDGYRPMSSEAVIAAAPDYILTTREGVEALGGVDAMLSRPGISLTPAGKARRVVSPDALLLLGFGPRLPQAVRELAQSIGTAK